MIKGEANPVYYKGYEEGKQQTLKDELEFLKELKIIIDKLGDIGILNNRIKQIEKELAREKE